MDEFKDNVKRYCHVNSAINEQEETLKVLKQKKQVYEDNIIQSLKHYNHIDKPIVLKDIQLCYKREEKPQGFSQRYIEETIDQYFKDMLLPIIGKKECQIHSQKLFRFILNNRAIKIQERILQKKSKRTTNGD